MPFPIPAVQRTKALWALTLLGALLEVYAEVAATTGSVGRHLQKVARWHKACQASVQEPGSAFSAGAKRDLDRRFAIAGPYMETEHMPPEQRAERYAALWWAALTEIVSARVMCPEFCRARAWAWLEQTTATVAEKIFLPMFPGCDEAGTKIALELP